MSVAFRRDSDEEHLEPKFERPIPAGLNRVTSRGLALIGERIAELEHALSAAADEPARQSLLRDLRYWQTRQITAEVMPSPSGDRVGFGSRVRITLNGAAKSLEIVGDDEADPTAGRISFSAPLARALMGAAVGEWLDFSGVTDAIKVVAIDVSP